MKNLIFSKINALLKSDKFVAILILVCGISVIFLSGYFKNSFASEMNDSTATKEIVGGQEIADTPSSDEILKEVNACYECGSGDVLGLFSTPRENCYGIEAEVNDTICWDGSFGIGAGESVDSKNTGIIGTTRLIPKDCELYIYEITYPVYWNGHNKYVKGKVDNRYDIHTGEWPSAAYFGTGGANVNAVDGKPTLEGNNFGAVYEAPNISIFPPDDGEDRTEIKGKLSYGSQPRNEDRRDWEQGFVTPDCSDSAPGNKLIGENGCASQNYSFEMKDSIISAFKPKFGSVDSIVKYLYPDDDPGCTPVRNIVSVIEDKDEMCLNDKGWLGWPAQWDVKITFSEICVAFGFCEGIEPETLTIEVEKIDNSTRLITLESRAIPGDENIERYVSTPCSLEKDCGGTVEVRCIWPDYLYDNWKSSELGSSICDPDVNYASVIAEEGAPPVKFNFCEYDGGYGYFDYVQYVTKRCNYVIKEGGDEISDDEYKSCKIMIDGSL